MNPRHVLFLLVFILLASLSPGPVSGVENLGLTGEEIAAGPIRIMLSIPLFSKPEGFFSDQNDFECALDIEIGTYSGTSCALDPGEDVILQRSDSHETYRCQSETGKLVVEPNTWGECRLLFGLPEELERFTVEIDLSLETESGRRETRSVCFLFDRELQQLKQTLDSLNGSYRDPMGRYRMGGLLGREPGFEERAISSFRKAIEGNESFFEAYQALSALLMEHHRHEEAIPVLEAAVTLFPGQDELWLSLIDCYFKTGSNDQVELLLQRNPQLQADNPDISIALGEIYLSNGKFDRAEKLLSSAIATQTDQPFSLYMKLVEVYLRRRSHQAARELLEAGLDIHSRTWDNIAAAVELLVRYNQGRYAISMLEQHVKTYPDDAARAYYEIGTLYLHFHRHTSARDYFLKTLEADPAQYNALFNLALIHSYRYEYEDAIRLWEEVARSAPESKAGKLAGQNIEIIKKEMKQDRR